jgi:hypothetical protein
MVSAKNCRRERNRMPPFEIFKLDDYGQCHFVETAQTIDAARERIGTLARLWPARYLISSRITGKKIFIRPAVH